MAATRKMIDEKHEWEVQKEVEVKSRVSILRQRYAARSVHGRSSKPASACNEALTVGTPTEQRRKSPASTTSMPSQSYVAAARQRVKERRQLAKWEATKNVEVKSRVSILRERNARLAQGRTTVTGDLVVDSLSKVEPVKNMGSKSSFIEDFAQIAMPLDSIPLENLVALDSEINLATKPREAMNCPEVESVSP
jgi:hypothetical protein